MKIGLSLSLCVVDIIQDRVRVEDVALIRANTRARDDHEWAQLMEHYGRTYWRQDPVRGRRIACLLRDAGRIRQPRVTDDPLSSHTIHEGIWQEVPA